MKGVTINEQLCDQRTNVTQFSVYYICSGHRRLICLSYVYNHNK